MPTFTTTLDGLAPEHLTGFFVGWPNPPTPAAHLRLLAGSHHVELVLDRPLAEGGRVIGYLTALSDGVSVAYLPHLEVLPEHQGQGLGKELVRRAVAHYRQMYMIDLCCDASLIPFYEPLGFTAVTGMVRRNYERQGLGG